MTDLKNTGKLKLRPLCMPYYYINFKKVAIDKLWPEGATQKGLAYTSEGNILPCCWCSTPRNFEDFNSLGFYDESLKVKNNETIYDIITSETWQNFVDSLYYDIDNLPDCCIKKCGYYDES